MLPHSDSRRTAMDSLEGKVVDVQSHLFCSVTENFDKNKRFFKNQCLTGNVIGS